MEWSLGTCEGCGSDVRVAKGQELVTDGDVYKCEDCECTYMVWADGEVAYIHGEEPESECAPCIARRA